MEILVTGAAGFIGSHVAERLAVLGHRVLGLDCLTDFYARELKMANVAAVTASGVEFHKRNLAVDDLSALVRGVEYVIHLAAQPGLSPTTNFHTYVENNITATHRLMGATEGIPSFRGLLYISTSSVYGADATGNEESVPKPTSLYGVTKLAAEQLVLSHCRDAGYPACALRLFSVYGPRERPEKLYPRLIRSILGGTPFPLYEGSEHHLRSFTFVGDIVEGIIKALMHFPKCRGEIFNLGTESAVTTGEGIKIVEEIIGRPATIERQTRRPGDQLKTHADITKARRVFGYDPGTTLREGLAREVAWAMEPGAVPRSRGENDGETRFHATTR